MTRKEEKRDCRNNCSKNNKNENNREEHSHIFRWNKKMLRKIKIENKIQLSISVYIINADFRPAAHLLDDQMKQGTLR